MSRSISRPVSQASDSQASDSDTSLVLLRAILCALAVILGAAGCSDVSKWDQLDWEQRIVQESLDLHFLRLREADSLSRAGYKGFGMCRAREYAFRNGRSALVMLSGNDLIASGRFSLAQRDSMARALVAEARQLLDACGEPGRIGPEVQDWARVVWVVGEAYHQQLGGIELQEDARRTKVR